MPTPGTLLRLAAFTADPAGGNPAGVWIGDALPPAEEMQRIAAEVGYSETAFLAPDGSGRPGRWRVRYFSPLAEVPFCGHATIASGVALAGRGFAAPADADVRGLQVVLATNDGEVPVHVATGADGLDVATLTSVEPWVRARTLRRSTPWIDAQRRIDRGAGDRGPSCSVAEQAPQRRLDPLLERARRRRRRPAPPATPRAPRPASSRGPGARRRSRPRSPRHPATDGPPTATPGRGRPSP